MICPHCERDTPATEPYCMLCGGALDLSFEEVEEAVQRRSETLARRRAEEAARSWLLLAAVVMALALAARLLLVPEPQLGWAEPAYEVAEPPAAEAPAEMPLVLPELEIPRDR